MASCTVALQVDPHGAVAPGTALSGEVLVKVDASCRCDGLTVFAEWRASGRGNPATGQAEATTLFTGQWEPGEYRYRFSVRAPLGPFTYDGTLTNIDWHLKARADVPWALDPKAEVPFVLRAGPEATELPYYFGPNYTPPDPKTQGIALSEGGRAVVKKPMALWLQILIWSFVAFALLSVAVAVPIMGACIAPFVLFFLVRRWMVKSKLGEPEVRVGPNPARPGDELNVVARIVPKKAVKLGKLSAELLGQERVVSGSGKHARTHLHRIHFAETPFTFGGLSEVEADRPIELRALLRLPPTAPLTFMAPSNVVEWSVKLKVELLGWPDWEKTLPLTVRPNTASALHGDRPLSTLPPTTFG